MPVIQHESRNYVLKEFRMMCLKCSDLCISSKPYPDTAMCKCGHVRLDGGISMGATLNGNPWAMEDYSIYRTEDKPKLELPRQIVIQHHNKVRQSIIENYKRHGMSQSDIDEIMSGR